MAAWFWIAVILTSPFWMVLGIIICTFLYATIGAIIVGIVGIIESFINLFRRRGK